MPVKSPAQFRLMEAAKNGGLGVAGPSPAVANKFLNATPEATKSSFAKQPRVQKFSAAMRKKPRPHVSL
jgi:hypothetical protein